MFCIYGLLSYLILGRPLLIRLGSGRYFRALLGFYDLVLMLVLYGLIIPNFRTNSGQNLYFERHLPVGNLLIKLIQRHDPLFAVGHLNIVNIGAKQLKLPLKLIPEDLAAAPSGERMGVYAHRPANML